MFRPCLRSKIIMLIISRMHHLSHDIYTSLIQLWGSYIVRKMIICILYDIHIYNMVSVNV